MSPNTPAQNNRGVPGSLLIVHANMSARSPLFEGISLERPSVLTVSFESDPSASLGAKLSSHDNGLTNEMFAPGYASVGEVLVLDGRTLAIRSGVEVGDFVGR